MAQKDPSKTEKGTPKRRKKSRKDGSVPKSQELGKATVMLAGLIALHLLIVFIGSELKSIFVWIFHEHASIEMTREGVYALLLKISGHLAFMLLPAMFIIALVAFLTQRLQVGSLWTLKVFKPNFSKMLNPMGGLKKLMIDPKMFIRMGKNILQAAAIGFAPYLVLKKEFHNLAPLFYQNVDGIAVYILSTASTMVVYALVPMLLIGIADVIYSRWEYEENLKMTKDEVKDERKQAEGDPKIKQQQRVKMLQVMSQRMLEKVPEADVVVTNPTHIAVALTYDVMEAPAPLVVAKGADYLAEKIKEIARENNVPIQEDKPLAQALYKSVEVGQTIPEELYQAVASVLAHLHKFKRP
ncbi:MAG: flagellar biosynthesis protein FlhB [Thermodesulfobacteriota bacterium]|nr:flagellar biosynthesis protein FlhB [Thermodesulfobacteriota bacterium]